MWAVAAGLVGLVACGVLIGLGTSAQIGDPSLCSYRGDCARTMASEVATIVGLFGLIIVVPVAAARWLASRLNRSDRRPSSRP